MWQDVGSQGLTHSVGEAGSGRNGRPSAKVWLQMILGARALTSRQGADPAAGGQSAVPARLPPHPDLL